MVKSPVLEGVFMDGEGDTPLEGKNASCSIRGHVKNGRIVAYIVDITYMNNELKRIIEGACFPYISSLLTPIDYVDTYTPSIIH